MEFRILGPLEVFDDGRAVDVGAGKHRALLAVLLLNANRVVSNDHLIDSLWGARAPGTAQKALQVYVSRLRKLLGKDRILTRTPGYELRVEPGELDLERFATLTAGGDLVHALGIWRGPPLAEFAYEPFAQTEIARLEELRLTCLEQRIEADLDAGRDASLVGELDALVRAHPLRERMRAQLMLALYRAGRQAEALEMYQAGRTLLSEELGLEPGAELKELQRRILAQDPGLDAVLEPEKVEHERAQAIESSPAPRMAVREVRKTVTVLFADVAGSTELGERFDPESLRRVMGRYFQEMSAVLEHHGATVEKFVGDAIMAVFGVPTVHEDDPLRAARAAVEMRARLDGLNVELETQWGIQLGIRIGLNTGEVVAGGADAPTYATGDAVNVAARLLQHAAAGEILMGRDTFRFVRDFVQAEPVEPLRVTGKETVVESTRLLAVVGDAVRDVSRFSSPMVGRERERRRLHDAFEQAVGDGSCQLFTILGPPGVGKSRLVQEFVDAVAPQALVARGRCLPYGEGITYWPVLEAVRDAADLDDAATPEESLERLAHLLEGEEDAELVARRVGEVIGLSDRSSSAEETFRAVRTLVEAVAHRRPFVLVFDDIHWGESTFLELVEHLADWTQDAPVLLVCIARPELFDVRPHWGGGKLNATSVLLEPLSEDESVELVNNLAGSDELDDLARNRIVDAASGNPLFVEEMLAFLLEDRADAALEQLPPTIQALLSARLDRLPDGERGAIEAAAVEGKVFHVASVAELASSTLDEVTPQLQALVRKGLVGPDRPLFSGDRAYRFRHLLIRDAAYESVPKELRGRLHERYARWLEDRLGERTLEFEEIIGYHFEQAFRYRAELGTVDEATRQLGRRAAGRLGEAGRRAFLRSDAPAGTNLISRAIALLRPDDPLRVELVPNTRVVQGQVDLSWADRVLTEAVEAAATGGDRRLAAHALVQRGFLRLFTGSDVTPQDLLDVAERSLAVFEELGDELGLARAWRLTGQAHYLDRRAGLCADATERALAHARRARDRFEEHEILEWLGIAHLLGPTQAEDALAVGQRLLDEMPDDEVRAEILAGMTALLAMQGRTADAHEAMNRAEAIMSVTGGRTWIATFWWSFVHSWHDDPEGAERTVRPAYEALGKLGVKSHFSSLAHALADALYRQGRYEEAERAIVECERAARRNDIHSQVLWRSIRAKVLARRGSFEAAEELAGNAVAYGEPSDFLLARAEARMDLAEVLRLAGRPAESIPVIEEAIELFEAKGNVVSAQRARTELERLGVA